MIDSLFNSLYESGGWENIAAPDADLRVMPAFYPGQEASALMQRLLEETPWQQEAITLWGKQHLQPRLSAWYGDPGSAYAYSGVVLQPHAWTPTLLRIKSDVENAAGQRFNSVLLNLYRNEEDSVGWHSDAEPELGQCPVIASLTLGETRTFRLRHKSRKELKPLLLDLADGSLLLMAGTTQHCWQHAVLKERRPRGPRINLTFRTIGL
ncbi:alpha-ketoglutarate-dependent dioxygenase AlkB [Noviherbaspirillum sp.]|uniref:alpha-ketoglutarate-dependent dioxygenase AlkB family protein n=1 Tax=Noviherbaspirillum sp. TaxID=1926288 RepID=UPI002D304726|nr:alpha-ketoglutarate-dependent dioxygenase AlkB [Noviherbaspirillum sp.]HZW21610.1 alpha-ketoglutarate-dependent dioxygenase AlkB [Noviherbaspirillum sp.]